MSVQIPILWGYDYYDVSSSKWFTENSVFFQEGDFLDKVADIRGNSTHFSSRPEDLKMNRRLEKNGIAV